MSGIRRNIPLLLILLANIVWLSIPPADGRMPIPTFDGVYFLKIAYNILNFGELGWQAYFEPFFYSFVTAIFSFLTDDLLGAAILVSKTSKVFLVLVVYLLAGEIYGRREAVTAAVLVSFHPHIQAIAGSPQSEALYTLLITLSVYLLWKAYTGGSPSIGAVAGLSFTAAYLTRSEGLFILLFLLLALAVLLFRKGRRTPRAALVPLVAAIFFTAASMPYLIFLKNHYGTWTMGTKTASVYFWVREKCFNDPDPDRTEYGLSPRGELNLISLTSRELIDYWLKDPARSIRVYLKNLKEEIPGFTPNTSGISHYPQVYPLYIVLPLAAGLLVAARRKRLGEGDFYLASIFLILFVYPFFTGGWWRYLVNYAPVLMVLAAGRLVELNDLTREVFGGRGRIGTVLGKDSVLWLFLLAVTLYHLWIMTGKEPAGGMKAYADRKYLLALEAKMAGEWARENLPGRPNYMVGWSRIAYYLDGRWTAMPEADYRLVIDYARRHGVDYIVYEVMGLGNYIRLRSRKSEDIEFAGAFESRRFPYYVLFFKLKK